MTLKINTNLKCPSKYPYPWEYPKTSDWHYTAPKNLKKKPQRISFPLENLYTTFPVS